jgi:hypothetical protein
VKIDNVGNVGIGTSSAVYPLVVSKAGAQGLEFSPDAGASASPLIQSYNRSGAAYLQMNFDGLQYVWRTSGTERMRLDSSGNLGIGVVAPTSKIAAAGVIESTSGGFKFPDGTTQTTAATGGGGGGVSLLQAVVTVATAAYYETIKTVTVAGVSSTSKVLANLAPNEDWDVDDLTGYDVIATPGSGTIDFMITAPGPIVGTFNINYLWS